MRRVPVLAAVCAALLVQPGLAAAPDGAAEQASAQAIVKNYKAYPRLTREPRAVSRRLAQLCRVLWPEEIAQDREQYGPHSLAWVHVYANKAAAKRARSRVFSQRKLRIETDDGPPCGFERQFWPLKRARQLYSGFTPTSHPVP